LLTKE